MEDNSLPNVPFALESQRSVAKIYYPATASITRQQFLKSLGFGGSGVILAVLGETLTSCRNREEVDYTKLESFLSAKRWKEATEETLTVMIGTAKQMDDEGDPSVIFRENFPCNVLQNIDRLWVKYSEGKFGFSIQTKICIESGVPYDVHVPDFFYTLGNPAWVKFYDRVGWKVKDSMIRESDVIFNSSAPKGHLPALFYGRNNVSSPTFGWLFFSILPSIVRCKI